MTVEQWLGENNKIGVDIWHKKYQHNGETFDEWLDRVSGGDKDVRQLIKDKKFLFGGRILSNRGVKEGKVTYSNCYVMTPPDDSIESIYESRKKLARTYSYGGGAGIDLSNLSPKGAKVNNQAKATSGAVSFMEGYSKTTEEIGQNGRRGALMISLDCSHPDLIDFINVKANDSSVTKANISVRVSDKFMQAVVDDKDWVMEYTRKETGETITKTAKAKDIFHLLCQNNWDYAEPGILFWDRIENWNLLSEDDDFHYAGTNPCLTGDTLIQTTDGLKQIKDLVGKTPDVYCMGNDGNLSIAKASKVWKTRENAQIVTVVTKRGNIRCTQDHLIFTTNRGWVEAKNLTHGDKIKGLNRSMKDEIHVAVALSGTKYIPEHRFVASYYDDVSGLDVHHLDGDTFNNCISNLSAISHGEHSKISNTGRQIESIRDEKGRYVSKETKSKRKTINQGKQVGTNWFVEDVIWNRILEDVYDMTVPTVHNFIANDMVVHNCAEEPLPAGGSCLLGSMNLSEYVTDDKKFDTTAFANDVATSIKALNVVLDEGLPCILFKSKGTVYEIGGKLDWVLWAWQIC